MSTEHGDLHELLARPPSGVEVYAETDRVRIRFEDVGRAPALVPRPLRLTPRGLAALLRAAFTACFPRPRPVEIELAEGELRVHRWRRSFRDVRAIRLAYDLPRRPPRKVERPPRHRVDLQVGDEWWQLVPTDGYPVTSWLAEVFAAGRAGALEAVGQSP